MSGKRSKKGLPTPKGVVKLNEKNQGLHKWGRRLNLKIVNGISTETSER
jgi:hypothetical protein